MSSTMSTAAQSIPQAFHSSTDWSDLPLEIRQMFLLEVVYEGVDRIALTFDRWKAMSSWSRLPSHQPYSHPSQVSNDIFDLVFGKELLSRDLRSARNHAWRTAQFESARDNVISLLPLMQVSFVFALELSSALSIATVWSSRVERYHRAAALVILPMVAPSSTLWMTSDQATWDSFNDKLSMHYGIANTLERFETICVGWRKRLTKLEGNRDKARADGEGA